MLVDTSNCLFDINSILFLVMAWGQTIAKLIMTQFNEASAASMSSQLSLSLPLPFVFV